MLATLPEKILGFFHDLFVELDALCGKPATDYCRLESTAGKNVIIADDGSLLSLIEIKGCLQLVGKSEFADIVSGLTTNLASLIKRQGHRLQIVFHYDPEQALAQAAEYMRPSRISGTNTGLDCNAVLDNWQETLAQYTAVERCWLVLWTTPNILPQAERKAQQKAAAKRIRKGPLVSKDGQPVGRLSGQILDAHHGALETIRSALANRRILSVLMDAHESLWWVRHLIDPEFTDKGWRALLPGDPLPLCKPTARKYRDVTPLLYPSIRKQLWPRHAEHINFKHLRIGDRCYAPLMMTLPPQVEKPFNELFRRLINERIPWRCCFYLNGDGLGTQGFKRVLASVMHFTATTNKQYNHAIDKLKQLEIDGHPLTAFQASFTTWVADTEAPNNDTRMEILRSRGAILAGSIQSWGASDTSELIGDPLLGMAATLPGMMPVGPSPIAVAPFDRIIKMLPLTRPASPWDDDEGSVLLRSPDGKLLPIGLLSSRQSSWIELGFAGMGLGKSVLLSTLNLCRCLIPGRSTLPHICILDIGPSSSGLITLLREMLPEGKKHLAAYHRLQMTPAYSINPFDTPLGCRQPLPSHLQFLTNVVCLLCTPTGQDHAPEGVAGLSIEAIKAAYTELEKKGNRYSPGIDEDVDQLISQLDIETDAASTWWEIVDELFSRHEVHAATRAQRWAVPTLQDVIRAVSNPNIAGPYQFELPNGELVTNFVTRSLNEALNLYPVLSNPTQFDIGDAQIVSLDLEEVAKRGGPGGDKQAGLMYMLARHVGAGRFFLMPEYVKEMPEQYREFHANRIDSIRNDLKYLGYDEVHRATKGSSSVTEQFLAELETAGRESRKWNLSIGLFSQSINDFPPTMIELATSFYILGSGTEENAKQLMEKLGFSNAAKISLQNLSKPTAAGASFLGIFKTDRGQCAQVFTNTIGSQTMWAFSSTTEDRNVRNKLYDIIGYKRTLELLARKYPGGVKRILEQRRRSINERGLSEANVNLEQDIIDEILAAAANVD